MKEWMRVGEYFDKAVDSYGEEPHEHDGAKRDTNFGSTKALDHKQQENDGACHANDIVGEPR